MTKQIPEELKKSIHTGFIDNKIISNLLYQPELLVNSKKPPKKVLSTIIQELSTCDEFLISVAFVTTSGVASLINCLKTLEKKGVNGKILVSQYLNFTQPEALKKLLKFKNIELKISVEGNSHSKGYIFKKSKHYSLIIGSSNFTASALSTNKEWNLKVSSMDSGRLVDTVINQFDSDFECSTKVTEDYIEKYSAIYEKQKLLYHKSNNESLESQLIEITPNLMQQEALGNLSELRKSQEKRAIIISATGTGKTYLSAFDVKAFNPKTMLFVVHRRNIAEKSMESFKSIFGNKKTMGLYSGNQKNLNKEFIFSTVQTLSKDKHLQNFSINHFDYIIIDESHRSGADSYLNLINYFKPKFLLGMTATPERTDGNDIFANFGHNIAYEIRLHQAMEENMLSQFHYYGVSELTVDGDELDDKTDFNRLTSDDRVNKIIEYADFYGSDNGITRGLVFCSRNEESKELSKLFNKQGFKTIALTGSNTEEERKDAIDQLESDNLSSKLDYIFTVDIFNEGIDIPKVNQIIMMRPTNSAIIFVQQLGRGLRKLDNKSYLTVIDFIGNYENNYLIPIALYGDMSYNKDTLRKFMSSGSTMIPGASTINFDEITKERIFNSIDSKNMQLLKDLKSDYNLLKYKLGRNPMMMDFIEHGSRDPFLYIEHSRSYYNFIKKVDNESSIIINDPSLVKLLELFSKEINNSKRVEECIILKYLIENNHLLVSKLIEIINMEYGYDISNETLQSCVSNINFNFIREKKGGKLLSASDIYDIDILRYDNDTLSFSADFRLKLANKDFKELLLDSINYSIYTFNKYFDRSNWNDGFVLYRKYSRKDVFRILNVAENPVAQNVGGYLVSQDNEHCPIFVNYHKDDDISESTKYEDEFINNNEFKWMSKSNRKIDSKDVQSILGANGKIRLPLFIKKNNDEGTDFYYMGDINPKLNSEEVSTMDSDNGKKVSVVKIQFILNNPVSDSMYQYITNSIESNTQQSFEEAPLQLETVKNIENKPHNNIVNLRNPVPLYDFYAAAGSFSEMQHNKDYSLIDIPESYTPKQDYFACKVVGESMNRRIPNGSICLFRKYKDGSRDGKIVLVENFNHTDSDFNSAFTVKTYASTKIVNEYSWEHSSIVLKPNSTDKSYKDIILDEESASEMRILGIFIKVLKI